jgi:hypothetical protein
VVEVVEELLAVLDLVDGVAGAVFLERLARHRAIFSVVVGHEDRDGCRVIAQGGLRLSATEAW